MLAKSSFIIVIAIIGFGLSGNAFGQGRSANDAVSGRRTSRIQSPRDVASGQVSGITEVYESRGSISRTRTGTVPTAQTNGITEVYEGKGGMLRTRPLGTETGNLGVSNRTGKSNSVRRTTRPGSGR